MLGLYTGAHSHLTVLRQKIQEKFSDEKGAGMVEYALLIVGIGILLILAMTFLSDRIGGGMSKAGKEIDN